MKRLTTLLMTLMLMCMASWADQTVTVSANSSDISEGLDLKVVAKLFAEAKNLEEFETMLNNPDSAFCNLDLNGDGQVDYLRVVETGEGNKRLIVLQAVLAKDIYQDVASIYVEKDEKEQVSVQIVGDEYVYGTNYIIEPVYVYRPVIYDWFWSTAWIAWYSPWYWGYYPSWWRIHNCWAHDWYWHHCYAFHHHHHGCSFRPGRTVHSGYHELSPGVSRREYATHNPERSFSNRNAGMTNARDIRNTGSVTRRPSDGRSFEGRTVTNNGQRGAGVTERSTRPTQRGGDTFSRTFGSRNTAETRSAESRRIDATRSASVTERSATTTQRVQPTTQATQRGSVTTTQRSTATTQRVQPTTHVTQRSTATTNQRSTVTSNRSTATIQRTTNTGYTGYTGGTTSRSSSSFSGGTSSRGGSSSSFSGGTTSRGSSSSSFSGSSSRSSSGGGVSHRR